MKKLFLYLALAALPAAVSAQSYTVNLQAGNFTPAATLLQTPSSGDAINGYYYRYIQFYQIPTEEQKAALAKTGIQLFHYLPSNTWSAAIPTALDLAGLKDANLRSIFTMPAEYKMTKSLSNNQYPQWAKSGGKVEVLVTYWPNLQSEAVQELLAAQGFVTTHALPHIQAFRLQVKPADISKLAALSFVSFTEPFDSNPQPENLPGVTDHRSNNLATSYNNGLHFDGTGMNVALNDDGVIGPHIDQTGRIANQFITFNNGNHGDHCSGTIFGAGNLNPTTRGMAYGATLRVYGVSNAFSTAYQAFDSIYNHYTQYGIRVTSTSYSNGTNTGYTSLARLMDVQIEDMPELSHIFSSGNSGTSGSPTTWYNITGGHKVGKSVITVGNVLNDDALATSSSRGPAADGRIKPDICAVGTDVKSTIINNAYDNYTGTSMACPGVAGTVTQLYHAYKTMHAGANPPSALIKAVILNTGDDLGNPGPDFKFGWGRINARRAYNLLQSNNYLLDSVSQAGSKTHTITVPANTGQVRIMVYWQDKPAVVNAGRALVNNLNMSVTTPASATVLPWVLNAGTTAVTLNSVATRGMDSLNNMEQVTIDTPTAGTYTVNVSGFSVPQGPQHYYVVYEFVTTAPVLTYPIGGESLVPGVSEYVRWDALGNSGTFTLQYSTNNGTSWTTLSSNIAADRRYYQWSPPSIVSGQALVRVTRNSVTSQSAAVFSIIGVPGALTVDWVCPNAMQVTYGTVTGATGYQVSVLGTAYMDSVGTGPTTTTQVNGIPTNTSGWWSVQALGTDNASGRRALAITYPPAPFNCLLASDLSVDSLESPNALTVTSCDPSPITDSIRITVKNNGSLAASNVAVSYDVNGTGIITEVIPGAIPPGSSATYTFLQNYTFSAAGAYEIKAWTNFPGDNTPANDTAVLVKTINYPTLMAVPFLQDFENFNTCDSSATCEATSCAMVEGWYNNANGADDDIDWRILSGPTATRTDFNTTGPEFDFMPGNVQGKYAYLESSFCEGKRAELISPCIDLRNLSKASMTYASHMFGSGMGELHMDVYRNGTWTNDVHVQTGDKGDQWVVNSVSLTGFAGDVINLRFRAITGVGGNSDVAIDAITVEPDGLSVANPSTNSSNLVLYPNPSQTGQYNLAYYNTSGMVNVAVTDATGRTIYTTTIEAVNGTAKAALSLGHIAAGVYFLNVTTESGQVQRKLMRL